MGDRLAAVCDQCSVEDWSCDKRLKLGLAKHRTVQPREQREARRPRMAFERGENMKPGVLERNALILNFDDFSDLKAPGDGMSLEEGLVPEPMQYLGESALQVD